MAKCMQDASFRKLDVDKLEIDQFDYPEEPETPGLGPDANEVQNLMNQNRSIDALKAAIKNPPYKTKDQCQKDRVTKMVIGVLTSIKQADMESALSGLDREEVDVLIKYVYKGFEFPHEGSSANLLAWHEKIYKIGGKGVIIRVFTDTKRLI